MGSRIELHENKVLEVENTGYVQTNLNVEAGQTLHYDIDCDNGIECEEFGFSPRVVSVLSSISSMGSTLSSMASKRNPTLVRVLMACVMLSKLALAESSEAHISFAVKPGPLALQEHYAHLFVLSDGKRVADGYTNFGSPTAVRIADGHYTILLVPATVPTSLSAIRGSYECDISGGMAAPIPVDAVSVVKREVMVTHADGTPISGNEIEVMGVTYAEAGCLVDHMLRVTTDATGKFVLPAVPEEAYQLRMALKEYLQQPIIDSPPFRAMTDVPGPCLVRIPAIPTITFHFVVEEDGKRSPLVSALPITVRGEPEGRFMPFPIDGNGDLRLDLLPDVTNFSKAKTLSLQVPGYAVEPGVIAVTTSLGQTVTVACRRSPEQPAEKRSPPPPIPAPFTVDVIIRGKVRHDGTLSLACLTGVRHDVLDYRPFIRTGDKLVVNEPAEKAFVIFALSVDGAEAIWRERIVVVPGESYVLHIDPEPRHFTLRLANLGAEPVDQAAIKDAHYSLVDAGSGLFAGYAKPSRSDPALLQTALYPGNYRLLIDQARGQAFDLGSVTVTAGDALPKELTFDFQGRKPAAPKAGEAAMVKELSTQP